MVAPDLQGRGLGRALLAHIEAVAAPEATSYVLFTGARSGATSGCTSRAGYRLRADLEAPPLRRHPDQAADADSPEPPGRAGCARSVGPALWQTRSLAQSAGHLPQGSLTPPTDAEASGSGTALHI